ncbi:MAG: hypothetical protein JST21_04755 [Bacteroidetes bacterium]|nr:hypothetical protein [Bacteroidota bacterium]
MKTISTYLFIAFLIGSCSKESNIKIQSNDFSSEVMNTTATLTPLNDLGKRKFKGYIGGLYPNGVNHPTGTYAQDLLKICKKLIPLDTLGNPSPQNGKIIFGSIGWSISGQNIVALKNKTLGNPLTNPQLLLYNFSEGKGQARINNIMNPDDNYWNFVANRIKNLHTSFRQVQIIYLESEDSTSITSFPGRPIQVKEELESCFRVFKQKFPNLKLVYLLARTTTFGDNQHIFNTEPCPYYFGWACKWAIEDQINGVPGTEYKGAKAVSPLVTWGFYDWATSTPRKTDGFTWTEDETTDGLHGNDAGKDSISTRWQNFLLTDRYAKNWYTK